MGSLAVLQSVASGNETKTPETSSSESPQSSLGVLQDVAGAKPFNMVGPNGEQRQVPENEIQGMRGKNFAVTGDNPGAVKAVNYKTGEVNYIAPSEVEGFHNAGHAIVEADGNIRYPVIRDQNGVIFQDPLEEKKAHDRVFQALDAHEKQRVQKRDMIEFGKAGAHAAVDTALGVTGTAETGPALEAANAAGRAGFRYLGRAALPGMEEIVGKQIAQKAAGQAATWALKRVVHVGIVGKILNWW